MALDSDGRCSVDVVDFIGSATYPGRIVVAGRDAAGVPFALYCLSGRSAASKQRDFVATDDGLEVIDTTGSGDDPLRHYQAAYAEQGRMLLGNGDHVAQLRAGSVSAESLPTLLDDVLPEPDPPILTPRIGVLATFRDDALDRLQGFGVTGQVPVRHRLVVERPGPGVAVAVKTYRGSAADVVVDGVPEQVSVTQPWTELVQAAAEAIDDDVRVAVTGAEIRDGGFAGWVKVR
ncbi:IMP cyclohydrolase [Microbacterium sp. KUDC0406]|uniref:IMP cyclohydrolase n=1 Tax=Microbacterium sp. KUDC0406 TaxID=2909588 RepID=UPI001F48CA46|nr:IMP cyclohydrolase [Microbacterium sp. KUDC0406]UJP10320.1 IMP cyclohydrolase [Microbacterium sp. KUDC0406]